MLEEKSETVGRYVLHAPIARGGMATVHAARLTGAEGFNRLVAAKRLHPELLEDPEFITMFHDEARIASRIHHPNVVPVLDVVVTDKEVMLVQEYVHGVPLSVLMRRARQALKPIPIPIAVAIAAGVLSGLHAAHEARDDGGVPLDVIHRDVSPQNVILSVEGVPRLLDFGIAKARSSAHQTRAGVVKGKLSYLSPEQIRLDPITRRVDIYAAGVVLWELIANRRVSEAMSEGDFLIALFDDAIPTLVEECSVWRRSMGQAGWKRLIAIDAVAMRAMSLRADERFATALQMAEALVAAHPPASQSEVAAWVCRTGAEHLAKLQRTLAESEEHWRNELRLEGVTISRKSIVVTHDEDERATLPMPEARPPSDPGARPARDSIDDLRAAIEKGRGGASSARVRAAREADEASARVRAAREAREADEASERGQAARDGREADEAGERGDRRAPREADGASEPSERVRAARQARDADELVERGERIWARRDVAERGDGEPSEPPESLAAVERGLPSSAPARRSRYVAWLAVAVVVVGLGAGATRRGSGGAAGATTAPENGSRIGTTVRSSLPASGETSAFPSTTVTGAAHTTQSLAADTPATDTTSAASLVTATAPSSGIATPGPAAPGTGGTGTTPPGATTFAPPSLLLPATFFAPSSGLTAPASPKAGPATPTACPSPAAATQPPAAGGPAEGGTDGGGSCPPAPAPAIVSTPKVVRAPTLTTRAAHDCKPLYDSTRRIFITPPGCHR